MNRCEDIRERLGLYLDNELQGEERSQFESHLRDCESCRSLTAAEDRFLNSVRDSRPLYVASPDLKKNVRTALSLPLTEVSTELASQPRLSTRTRIILTIAAAVLILLLLPVLIWRVRDTNPPSHAVSSFALMAADTHLRHLRGQLPLEINSTSPRQISDWFANKVDFKIQIPNYQESSGGEKLYTLEGGRLVAYENDYAAYVAYQMNDRPISLVITSNQVVEIAGGELIKAKGLVFHYNAMEGLKVITWSDRGLTYALVSDLEERGQKSCMVCHQGIKDQDFIAPLKPK